MQDEYGDYIDMVEGCTYEENVEVTIKVDKCFDNTGRPTCMVWTDKHCNMLGLKGLSGSPVCMYNGEDYLVDWEGGYSGYFKPSENCPVHDMREYY